MTASLWLAYGELWARKRQFAASAALVAAAVGLCSGTELVSQAREAAVVAETDYLGPSLRLIPAGVTSTQLARFELGERLIPEHILPQLRRELSPRLRGVEGRLLSSDSVDTLTAPIIGMAPGGGLSSLADVSALPSDAVMLGSELARRVGKQVGEPVRVLGRSWRVHRILPVLGSVEDLAVIAPLGAVQDARRVGGSLNEIRLHLASGAALADVAAVLRKTHPELSLITSDARDGVAERETSTILGRHRAVVYWLTALVVALCLAIAAYLNAAERRVEMAVLVAMGGTARSVLATFVARAGIIGLLGAAVGYLVGAGVAIAQDPAVAGSLVWSWMQPAAVLIAATLLSVVATIPVALYVTRQDNVGLLQG